MLFGWAASSQEPGTGAERQIAGSESFESLLRVVSDQLRDVSGVGKLYRYDTAFRIGAYLGVFPARVYLHAGTREGARVLGLDHRKDALEMSEVPAPLRRRQPHEVEDILCIYQDRFPGSGHRSKTRRVKDC